jgi:hypothetical protein
MSQPVHGYLRFCFDLSECANCRSVVPTYTIGEACDAGPITCREKSAPTLAWENDNPASGLFALIHWSGLLQCGEQILGAVWHGHRLVEDNRFGADVLPVEVFVRAVVWAKSGTCQGDAGEEAPRA